MKRGTIWIALTCLIVASMVLVSCNKTTTTTTSVSTTTSTSTSTTTTSTTTITVPSTTISPTTTTTGNWWDTFGKPQYGGTMTLRLNNDLASFDPISTSGLESLMPAWMETIFADDWTVNPAVFNYHISFRPYQYITGDLAKSYEFTDPNSFVVHLRQGIHWQNIPPANGREFTSADVVFDYDRMFGLGGGFTKPQPAHSADPLATSLISVTATDNYTVVFKFNTSNPEYIYESIQAASTASLMENPDAVAQWGNLNDWHHAIGTGPFILQDFVGGSSATLVRNPNYWAYDERYPQNQLPYVDTVKWLIIPDVNTTLAAFRTGKIDYIDGLSFAQAQALQKTNPKTLEISLPTVNANSIDPRNDQAPFNDIRVRKAMQMAIDLPTIAATYYGGSCSPNPSTLCNNTMTGWGFPYDQWPQSLKDEYAYNPTAAKQLLATAGYPNGFKTTITISSSADQDLLQIVKSYFLTVGIDMSATIMDATSFRTFVQNNGKQDALAMNSDGGCSLGMSFEPSRQFSRYLTNGGSAYLHVSDPVFDACYTKLMADTNINDVKQDFENANKEVAQQHFAISLLDPNLFTFYQPWLKGYNGQSNGITGTKAGGPVLFFFYGSRFWIDSNLKESMGY